MPTNKLEIEINQVLSDKIDGFALTLPLNFTSIFFIPIYMYGVYLVEVVVV